MEIRHTFCFDFGPEGNCDVNYETQLKFFYTQKVNVYNWSLKLIKSVNRILHIEA